MACQEAMKACLEKMEAYLDRKAPTTVGIVNAGISPNGLFHPH
jgi:hypothetical protein